MTDIFKAHIECQMLRTVLVEVGLGLGKTRYCQILGYDWATTEKHEWVLSFPEIKVLLPLKHCEIKPDIWEANDDKVLPEEIGGNCSACRSGKHESNTVLYIHQCIQVERQAQRITGSQAYCI